MRPVALVYPPTCDPTAPYLSLPTLTGWLRSHGVEVLPVDANVEAFDALLRRAPLQQLANQVEHRLLELERKTSLTHQEQLIYGALWAARGDALAAPDAMDDAVAVLRDRTGTRFYDMAAYGDAVTTVEAGMRLISAAHAPLTMSFTGYRTPFSLLNAAEVASDAGPQRNPFHDYFCALVDRLKAANVLLVGISVAFPGQIQPAYSLAHLIKQRWPEVHVTVGGPALTQLFQGLSDAQAAAAKGPFDSVITYEGEVALLELVRTLQRGETPPALVRGEMTEDMGRLPAPDFTGLPLEKYFSPELVLPYDPTRGCYWGKCTFCHYGLAEVGTAAYRERPVEHVLSHVKTLMEKHGTSVFYFSQDAVNPKTMLRIVRTAREQGLRFRWSTDMRPERSLTPERCAELREGGALSMALGVESASPRVLELIDKGVPVETVRGAIESLAGANIAVEAMCFTDFPTENAREAMATVAFVDSLKDKLGLFICGEFDLTKGSLVAQDPSQFGIEETWRVAGDELGMGLFYQERKDPKSPEERQRVDEALTKVSRNWRLEHYPWAGALSTAHTMLYYARFGPDCFRGFARHAKGTVPGAQPKVFPSRFDVLTILEHAPQTEGGLWEEMVYARREVGRQLHDAMANALPRAKPSPGRYLVAPGGVVTPASGGPGRTRSSRGGRRGTTAANATKQPVRGWS